MTNHITTGQAIDHLSRKREKAYILSFNVDTSMFIINSNSVHVTIRLVIGDIPCSPYCQLSCTVLIQYRSQQALLLLHVTQPAFTAKKALTPSTDLPTSISHTAGAPIVPYLPVNTDKPAYHCNRLTTRLCRPMPVITLYPTIIPASPHE